MKFSEVTFLFPLIKETYFLSKIEKFQQEHSPMNIFKKNVFDVSLLVPIQIVLYQVKIFSC